MELHFLLKYLTFLVLNFNSQALTIANITTVKAPHSCQRKCILDQPMTCVYTLTIRHHLTSAKSCLSCPHNKWHCKRSGCIPANNVKRTVTLINSQYPGPIIDVCLGDTIVSEVRNRLSTESTLMHWHGMFQRETPYMDGADFVSQLPMAQANEFRYIFEADPSGTHFYHSHIAFQRMDGMSAPLIVRLPDEINPHKRLYDYDINSHVIMIQDWNNVRGSEKYQVYRFGSGSQSPDALLVNGLGRFEFFNKYTNRTDFMDSARFRVQKGYRYRMRLINAGVLNCATELSIDKHDMTLISSDGYDFQPVTVKSITSYPGETYDFILNANQDEDVYWMKFKGEIDCVKDDEQICQVAVLDYTKRSRDIYPKEEPIYNSLANSGKHYNPVNEDGILKENIVLPTDLIKDMDYEGELKETADFTYFMRVSNIGFKYEAVPTPQLDYITSTVGKHVLLPQRDLLDYTTFCNYSTTTGCKTNICVCSHLIEIPLDDVVELIMVDETPQFVPHTFHFHGYAVRIIASESFNRTLTVKDVEDMYYNGTIKKNLKSPVMKDTFFLPARGYVIVRFKATNPGFWFFHCHLDMHMELGMHSIIKVGQDSDMIPVPDGLPLNARFLPDVKSA